MKVKFEDNHLEIEAVYVFLDSDGNEYFLDINGDVCESKNLTVDFFDKFYFCEKIEVDYKEIEGDRYITNIRSYS